MKLWLGMMTQNELHDLKENVARFLPYIDGAFIVDGGSQDDTIFYMRNWAKKEPKLNFFVSPWPGSFPEQRNNYVRLIGEVAQPGDWIVTADPDEFYDDRSLEKMRSACQFAEKNNKNLIGLQCRSVSYAGPERVWENLDEYWKELLIKWDPNFHYTGYLCHEGKGGVPHNILRTDLIYEHRKSENVIWKRGARNLVHAGGGPNLGDKNPRWGELLGIMKALGLSGWHELNQYMLKGNIDSSLRDWIVKYHDLDGFDGASEHREMGLYYYVYLHPEECRDLPESVQEWYKGHGSRWCF